MTTRTVRTLGVVACLVGVLLVAAVGRVAILPGWTAFLGLAIVALGWACFGYSIFKDFARARAHTPKVKS